MKQYDKIWVPDEEGDFGAFFMCPEAPTEGRISPEKNVIVLTIEELINVFAAGGRYAEDIANNPGATNYLQSKGIKP